MRKRAHASQDAGVDSSSSERQEEGDEGDSVLQHTDTRHWGFLKLRAKEDADEQDWWFASTAIPLLAATIAPLANVLSIAALVGSWRIRIVDAAGSPLAQLDGIPYNDPRWCYWLNFASLICGYIGNLFLLMNFTNRIRYIIALPVTIILWYISTGILITILVCMDKYQTPHAPQETYSQAFWYGVISAVLYLICSMILMVNMLGYFLGHYREHFNLTESQRTLILQTFLFFIWLAGGAGVFSKIEQTYGTDPADWSFQNALYFCDVTILTVGFGDLTTTSNVGRGFVLPYSVGGIIMLGLMISSISTFASEISRDNVVKARINRQRIRTLERTEEATKQLQLRIMARQKNTTRRPSEVILRSLDARKWSATSEQLVLAEQEKAEPASNNGIIKKLQRTGTTLFSSNGENAQSKRSKRLRLLRAERDRFAAMRNIQQENARFKRWSALTISILIFGILWCVGAVVFWQAEKDVQGMSYFEALYFCYVSLLTIGYGDFAPKSSAGRPFFVVWSLLAVPSITILISDMGSTVISEFKAKSSALADFTVLPKSGIYSNFLKRHPWLLLWLQQRAERKATAKRLEEGFPTGPDPEAEEQERHAPTLDDLAGPTEKYELPDENSLAKELAVAIKQTAHDMKSNSKKKYSYEEWVQFTHLIRFSSIKDDTPRENEDEDEGLVNWDWIGDDSPMLTEQTEPEWLLDRLCESMARYLKHQSRPQGIVRSQPAVASAVDNAGSMRNRT